MKYDIIIVGGGPIGIACFIEAKKNNLSALILEKGTITNSIYNYPLDMTFFSTSEKLTINDIPFNCIAPKPGRKEALEYYRNVANYYDININLYEEVLTIDKSDYFTVTTSKNTYFSDNIILATGFYDIPHLLGVEGENLPIVSHYYKEAHPYAFQNIVVIGANNSAVDAALECYRKGANVTLIVRGSEFTSRLKYWVKPDIENRIKEGAIKAYFNSTVEKISHTSITVQSNHETITIETDHILAMTGYEPNFNFLERAGVLLQDDGYKTPFYNPETMETNVKDLYLAGVVSGGLQTNIWFIENSRVHASQIINHIQSK
ncbi:YpdA family putative bacillithiol disulfide reductase [Faecalibacter rhinopitheci]|uniref:YpdA family putative bacillithiol disulfide reductase n=1 Tax=Faecalibacter rhinopitheci TaxID=2779678 RepID=A0A8J7K4Y8_9FLAO|nr:YpdA family putative bacillithiol disulfide reductase [Faecalibacter rhinopitheci]MBF0598264.1 YpdA family putative bacillithiol disulfide reductase [Faecalibacter rhinopitheci]